MCLVMCTPVPNKLGKCYLDSFPFILKYPTDKKSIIKCNLCPDDKLTGPPSLKMVSV